ncbi:hypothetical protein [Cellulomonas cellasea]|uniref:Uncharacterized protein n=1 Tax=Cellulomonas cellasea TaxID=43670 RepID=A0A7W4UDM6_9CELL|nr:hypothetical protein [Cellulomonas cellasea]MBB2922272.1 hypothetical protein [Cellulomonas cellasea]
MKQSSPVATATVVLGPFLDDVGEPWPGEVTVTSSTPRVWAATGAVVAPRPAVVPLAPDGTATVALPVTDQPGFTDGEGRALTGWTYTVVVALAGTPWARRTFALPGRLAVDGAVRVVVVPDAQRDGGRGAPDDGHESAPAVPDAQRGRASAVPVVPPRPAGADGPRGLTRRESLRAGAVALGAAAATGWAAGPAAAGTAGTGAPAAAGRSVPVLRGAVPLAQVIADDVTIGTVATPRTLTIKSSGAGGTERGPDLYDSTGRLVLEAHQPHFQGYGESVRVQLKNPRAKGMVTYQAHWPTPHYPGGDFTFRAVHPTEPVTIAWIGAHFLDNEDPSLLRNNLRHGHLNFEVPDSKGYLQTRLEIKLIDTRTGKIGTDRSAIRTNLADFEHQVGAAGEQLRIVGGDSRNKDLAFSLEHGPNQPRWVLRAAAGGARLQFRRYAPGAVHVDSPLQLDPGDGRVLVGGDEGSAAGLVVRRRDGVALTVQTLVTGGHGILVSGPAGDPTARVIEGDATGDALRRFVVQVDGTIAWGDGAAERDTLLYRRGPNQLGTDGGVFLRNSAAPPTAPAGGVLFVQDGALRYRGSAGTVTTLAAA